MSKKQLRQSTASDNVPWRSVVWFENKDTISLIVFAIVTLMIIFSVEIPINLGISQYESINSEDFAVLLLTIWLVERIIVKREPFTFTLLPLTSAFFICSCWILLTFLVALIRSPEPVTASALWLLKWFEVMVFFICIQHLMTKKATSSVVLTIIFGGSILGAYSILASEFITSWRVRVFFNNPNGLAAFFTLLITLSFVSAITSTGQKKKFYIISSLFGVAGILATLSRSGVLGAGVAIVILLMFHWQELSKTELKLLVVGVITTVGTMAVVLQNRITRFIEWFNITDEGIKLAGGQASRSFTKRLELFDKAIDLFVQKPIFGYGWFASPSRVGFLDNLYTILLVELGLPGLILMLGLFTVVVKTLFQARVQESRFLSSAVLAWFLGLLAMSIGGPYARSPHMMMLWTLMIVTTWKTTHDNTPAQHTITNQSNNMSEKRI